MNPHWLKPLIATLGLLIAVGLGCDTNGSSIGVPDIPDEEEPTDTTGQSGPIDTGGKIAFTVYWASGGNSVYLGSFFAPTEAHLVSPGKSYANPRISHSGSMLTMVSYTGGDGLLYSSENPNSLTVIPKRIDGHSVTWAKNDASIYFHQVADFTSGQRIFHLRLSDNVSSQLSSTFKVLSDFRGDSLLVRNRSYELFSYDPTSGQTRKLTNPIFASTFLDEIDWDEESDLIALSHVGTSEWSVSLASPDGNYTMKVTDSEYRDWRPRFGPSGWLFFDRAFRASGPESLRIMKFKISNRALSVYLDPSSFDGAEGVGAFDYSYGK